MCGRAPPDAWSQPAPRRCAHVCPATSREQAGRLCSIKPPCSPHSRRAGSGPCALGCRLPPSAAVKRGSEGRTAGPRSEHTGRARGAKGCKHQQKAYGRPSGLPGLGFVLLEGPWTPNRVRVAQDTSFQSLPSPSRLYFQVVWTQVNTFVRLFQRSCLQHSTYSYSGA